MAVVAGLGALAASSGCARGTEPLAPPPPDGGDAQRLVAVLDYVASDYGQAVRNGAVADAGELEEQTRFVSDAEGLARAAGAGPDSPVGRAVAEVAARVRGRAEAAEVARACRDAREAVVSRFALRTAPGAAPAVERARALYARSCAVCHGASGDARTPQARLLDPPPANFHDPERRDALSPYRVFNALTFGVPGTAMASFDALTPQERWDLAFFVLRLGHEGEPARGPATLALAEQAARTDAEIRESLRAAGQPDPAATLAYLRTTAAFEEPPPDAGLERTRRLLRSALAAFGEGRAGEADRLALDAYLQGFEPLEARLRARDPGGTADVEAGFRELRAAIGRGSGAAVQAQEHALERRLDDILHGGRPTLPFLAGFVIYFREGVEAALLVAALLAGVRRLGRPEARRWIHGGWMAAVPAGLLTWWATERLLAIGAADRELTEAVVALLAAVVLFTMSFWMISRVEARRWTGYLRRGLEESLTRRNLLLLAALAFLAVYREAAETVLFTQALLLEAGGAAARVWAGAAAGLAAVVVIAFVMNRTVVKLPMTAFFAVSGALLCGLAISFAGSGLFTLVSAGYLPPRPVPFPDVPWMGIHPDLTPLLVQLAIVTLVAAAALATLRRRPAEVRETRRR